MVFGKSTLAKLWRVLDIIQFSSEVSAKNGKIKLLTYILSTHKQSKKLSKRVHTKKVVVEWKVSKELHYEAFEPFWR